MGFFGFDKRETDNSQSQTDNRAAATDGSLIGYGSNARTAGGALLESAGGAVSYASDYDYSSIYNDPEIALTALKEQRKLSGDFLGAMKARDATLADVLAANAALAEGKQTDGEAGRNKTMLYVTLAVLALVGWIFWKR
jgi:hypothetical protein